MFERVLLIIGFGLSLCMSVSAQQVMTPEKLWQVQRVSPLGLNKDN